MKGFGGVSLEQLCAVGVGGGTGRGKWARKVQGTDPVGVVWVPGCPKHTAQSKRKPLSLSFLNIISNFKWGEEINLGIL